MRVYLDTSVVLRVLFREPDPVMRWGAWDEAWASRLWLTEALRTVDRLRLGNGLTDRQVAALRGQIDVVHGALHVIPVTESILERAGGAMPTVVGTLDAIHLASALVIRESVPVDLFLTHDEGLGIAARSLGFAVQGVSLKGD